MAETAAKPIAPRDSGRATVYRDNADRDAALVHVIDDDEAVRDSLALLLDAAGIAVPPTPRRPRSWRWRQPWAPAAC